MADEKPKPGDPMELVWFVLGALAIIIGLWLYSGAYKNADLKGLFLAPPPPVGPGGSYGPSDTNNYYNNPTQ
jgi:hypothetical protein